MAQVTEILLETGEEEALFLTPAGVEVQHIGTLRAPRCQLLAPVAQEGREISRFFLSPEPVIGLHVGQDCFSCVIGNIIRHRHQHPPETIS